MKTAQEFRNDVYEKQRRRTVEIRKRRKAILCGALAVVVLVCCAAVPGMLRSGDRGIPLSLQVGRPAKVEDLGQSAYKSGGEEWDMIQQARENAVLEQSFQDAVNNFARDMSPLVLTAEEQNSCWSPLSAYYAMALTGAGARGQTEQEFLDLLGAEDLSWLADQCERYYRQHYHENEACTFTLANSLWIDGRRTFAEDYLENSQKSFYASMFQADFTNPEIGGEISQWVTDNTGGLLKPELQFDRDTMLAILNTVYFKAAWEEKFYEKLNTEEEFTRADETKVETEFMLRGDFQDVLFGQGFLRASLALQDDAEMIFILPDEGVTPQQLLENPEAFEQMFYPTDPDETQYCEVHWRVPKFSMENRFDLKDAFSPMMPTAFDEAKADFSRMSKQADLYMGQVDHGVHMAIDEEGVEAAAYTMVAMNAGSALPPELPVVEMNLNRPFLFAVVADDMTDQAEELGAYNGSSILFVGMCGDPTLGN